MIGASVVLIAVAVITIVQQWRVRREWQQILNSLNSHSVFSARKEECYLEDGVGVSSLCVESASINAIELELFEPDELDEEIGTFNFISRRRYQSNHSY